MMGTPAIQKHKMTVDEFAQHYLGKRAELINGEVVEYMPTSPLHAKVVSRTTVYLGQYALQHKAGDVLTGEPGYIIREGNQESVRAPDVAFVRKERVPQEGWSEGFCTVIPDLVVEVISPSDSYRQLRQKVEQWLSAGVQVVWVVDPERRVVEIWRPDGTLQTLHENDTLTGDPVLSGFQIRVGELFE